MVLQTLFLLFLFKYFLIFQRKINKIREIKIPPESMGFLLEESIIHSLLLRAHQWPGWEDSPSLWSNMYLLIKVFKKSI